MMEQKIIQLQLQAFINPFSEEEILDAVTKAVDAAGLSAFKTFLNDYKVLPDVLKKAA